MTSLKNLLRYAKTGVASKDMTSFDKLLSLQLAGSKFEIKTLTGMSPLPFKSDGSALTDWSIDGASGGVGDPTSNIFNPIANADCIYNASVGRTVGDSAGSLPCNYSDNVITFETVTSWTHTAFLTECEVGKNYTFACDAYGSSIRMTIYAVDEDMLVTRLIKNISGTKKVSENITMQTGEKYICVSVTDTSTDGCSISQPILALTSEYDGFEPYGYEIEVTCGGTTQTIYLDSPLGGGDSISMEDTGITITPVSGSNTFSVGTAVQPSGISITGYIKSN